MRSRSLFMACALAGLARANPTGAQGIEFLSVPYTATTPRADTGLSAVQFRATIAAARLQFPSIIRTERFRVFPEITVVRFHPGFRSWDTSRLGPVPIQSARLRGVLDVSMEWDLGSRWTLLGSISGTTDRTTFDAFLAGIRQGWPWSYGFGAARSLQFGAEVPIPILYLRYDDQVAHSVELLAPAYLEYWYRPGERFGIGFAARLTSWRFRETRQVEYTLFRVGPSARWYIWSGIALQWEGGVTIGQVFNEIEGGQVVRKLAPADRTFLMVGIRADTPWWRR